MCKVFSILAFITFLYIVNIANIYYKRIIIKSKTSKPTIKKDKNTPQDPGRPNKLKPKTLEILFDALEHRLSYKDSCLLADITYKTFRNWIIRGEKNESGDEDYFHFLHDVKRAIVTGKLKKVKRINLDPSWQSDAWSLERQFPDEYSKTDKIKHSGNISNVPKADLSKLTDKELKQYRSLLDKSTA